MAAGFITSELLLGLVTGAAAYIGFLHLWFWRRGSGESTHLWIALFCLCSIAFQLGRYLEIRAEDAQAAVLAGRVQVACVPLLAICLVGYSTSLRRRRASGWIRPWIFAAGVACATIGIATDWMVTRETFGDVDWFGASHESAVGGHGLILLLLYVVGCFGYVVSELNDMPELLDSERRVLLGSLAIYTGIGVYSIASALGMVEAPELTQYGLIVIAVAISHQIILRHRRLRNDLEEAVEERTRALAASEVRNRQLVENAPIGIFSCDRAGRLLTVNPYAARMLRVPRDAEAPAGSILELDSVAESGISDLLQDCLEKGRPAVGEFSFTSPWGAELILRIHVVPILDADEQTAGLQVLAEDVGERRAAEERTRQSQRMEAVGALAAGIAHEINNPMAYVRSNLAMLRDEWEKMQRELISQQSGEGVVRLAECLALIDDSMEGVERTVAIVRGVGEFANTSNDTREFADLNELASSALRSAVPTANASVRVELDLGEMPPVYCSPQQIRHVVNVLLDNALYAMDGRGTLRIETERSGEEVFLRVIDDGCGISQTHLDIVFDPFFTTRPVGEGTGLGLYVAFEIMRFHGGGIRVESQPGEGACFEIHLPIEGP